MSKLVRLKDGGGNAFYVNPDHVSLLTGVTVEGGASLVNQTALTLFNGIKLAIPGGLDEVNDKLEGKSGLL